MQDYAQAHEASLRELYKQLFGEKLEHVTPTYDTLNRALQVIPHQVFKRAYQDWIAALLRGNEETRQICIDGKTMSGVKKLSPDTESHIVSVYDPHLQLGLSVDAGPIKRNGLDSIRRFLDELGVTDALISLDALGCQRQVAEQVLEVGGHYLLQVKSNQPTLLQELEDSFPRTNKGFTLNKEEDLGHGRIETRQMKSLVLSPEMLEDPYAFKDWARIKSIHQLSRKRYDKRSGKETTEISYYISSVEDSKRIFRTIRDHRKIETQLHYMAGYLPRRGRLEQAGWRSCQEHGATGQDRLLHPAAPQDEARQVDPTRTDAAGQAQPATAIRPKALARTYSIMRRLYSPLGSATLSQS